ncbi:MAG: porin family protein [Bacteroidia bacterium]|jgi:hypothetical protein|nr:porin family protein [Bacteroidia bacterium]
MRAGLLVFFAAIFLTSANVSAQEEEAIPLDSVVKPQFPQTPRWKPKLMPGAGLNFAVINNRQEVRGLYKPGLNFHLFYLHRPWFAISGEYTYHFRHDAAPALADIDSWNADLNGHLIMRIGESETYFNAIFGVGYLYWNSVYVGPNSAHTDFASFSYGMNITQRWVGANLGAGFSYQLTKRMSGYANFKVRFASSNNDLFSISDTAFQFGVRADLSKKDKSLDTASKDKKDPGITLNERSPKYKAQKKGVSGMAKFKYRWLKKRQR